MTGQRVDAGDTRCSTCGSSIRHGMTPCSNGFHAPDKPHLNILCTEQGVFMGDHAETVTTAVTPRPGETVEELVDRTIGLARTPAQVSGHFLTIRVATP